MDMAPISCIGIAGILGNGLVLVVMLHRKSFRKDLRNALVINQSVVDFLNSVFLIASSVSISIPKSYEGAGIWYCWLFDSQIPFWILCAVSTTNLMAITIERYIMVVYPVHYHYHFTSKIVHSVIGLMWLVTGILIGAFSYPFSGVLDGVCYFQNFFPHQAIAIFCSIYYNVIYFALPLGMFVFCYGHMGVIMKKRRKIKPSDTTASGRPTKLSKRQLNLTKVMLLVSISFVICWAPLNTHYLLMFTGAVPNLNMTDHLFWGLMYLSFINSCINPVVYAFNYNDFRHGLHSLFCRRSNNSGSTTTSNS